ncbi:hypothetical protein NIES4074_12910 [Cylindrospermum sp. NIES-4074]|nr:hypothetical protein NIES4074_12910 [Cylindrospermum sp. NIES-4074]
MINAFRRIPRDLPGNPDIRIIGPQSSGKTTFMASLARWPNAKLDSPIQSVNPFDDESGRLIAIAQDILENGLSMAPTRPDEDVHSLPLYTLLIELKPAFQIGNIGNNLRFQVSCREYSGEIIKDLRGGSSGINLSDYLDDCADSSGLLLLVDGTSREDNHYAQAFATLQTELNVRLIGRNKNLRQYRIAVVFSKAEQAQVWIHRYDIQKFTNRRFPKTKETLNKWSKTWRCPMNYFFCSAFGMKGSPATPNVKVQSRESGGTYAVIDNTSVWRPFGLVAPIYWLHTGKDDQRLRDL